MAEVSPFAELLGQAIYQYEAIRPLLPTYGHLIVSALFPIYAGAHASLSRPSSAAKPPKKSEKNDGDNSDSEAEDEEDQGDGSKMEGLEPSDALMFPLTAGLTLGGLYLVIKYMGADLLNKVLGFYFSQMGIFFAMAFLKDALVVIRSFAFPRKYSHSGKVWKQKRSEPVFTIVRDKSLEATSAETRSSPLPGFLGSIPLPGWALSTIWTCRKLAYQRAKLRINLHRVVRAECSVSWLDLLSLLMALPAIAYFTFVTKPWWLTNFLGFSFCYGTLQFMSPSSFVTGSLILSALFFYDIYFVFYTPLMVTVAKKLDVPIKLLFPRPDPSGDPDLVSLAMLGLGDIVIPGMMVGLALRFDLFLYYKRKGLQMLQANGKEQEPAKPIYQTATGGWGEWFWTRTIKPALPELEPPYHDARTFPKTYFKASVFGYVFGMVATLLVMQCFNHAQPALLYLVPGVLLSLWGTALVKGDLHEMFEFSDMEEEEESEDSADKKEETQKDDSPKMGLFQRVFYGVSKSTPENSDAPADKQEEKPKETDGEREATSEPEESKDKDSHKSSKTVEAKNKDLDLFSISLYVPNKNKSTKVDRDAKATEDEENWTSVGGTENENEPPHKRRRRSPRNAAKASQ
ncbi:aspartic endopeptidase [Aspergillus candidus]|uniref:Signal peptide peptidase n=1 Tax=Aspergillus candidus TaxID=41067 RepID=A0A2I2EYT4_ASPCN|nr:signal peptide peptidase [Aspergillus candidus]PLB33538.1 signal peptide peptidase [Aspergillus candidus]